MSQLTPTLLCPGELASVLPAGSLTLVSSCSTESALLADEVAQAGAALGDMTFCGVFVPGLNKRIWRASDKSRVLSFFMTPDLKAAGAAVEFLPLCYADILALLRRRRPDAALFMAAPPDAEARCSLGPAVDFLADLLPDIPVRIAHLNPSVPRTHGHMGVHFADLTAYYEGETPLLQGRPEMPDAATAQIASHIASLIPDGAMLQTGLGKIPGAVQQALTGHRGLSFHTGLIGDRVLDLLRAGALAPGAAVTAGVAIGSAALYEAVGDPVFSFQPVSVTHSAAAIAAKGPLITINSALEVDLFGQSYAELTPNGLMSGPGGALDFAHAARASGGLRILALPSTAAGGRSSRIVAAGAGPILLGRMDTDIVVTEHGIADLRAKTHQGRAKALIGIAAPEQREPLERTWSETARTF